MDYDLSIIGAGWAGFNAALKAKELGQKVALIEKASIGGTCLNQGCIPTKALIQSAKIFSLCKKSANFGIENSVPVANLAKIQERKEKIIQQLRSGIQFMLKGVDLINEEARIISNEEIETGSGKIKTKHILIAVGSKPIELQNLKFDGTKILTSDDILKIKEIPKKILIIGGGVIGCEFAGLFSNLGSKVTVVEMMPQLLPGVDKEIAKKLETIFKKKGVKINTGTDATKFNLQDFDKVLVCVGRVPDTQNLNLDKLGIKTERNKIVVDDYLKTNIPNIFAAGDCTGKIMLAHFAAYQGIIAAENIAKPQAMRKADNTTVPNCIFTDPEIACAGLTDEEAKAKGIDINISKFDFLGSGMARIMEEAEGFIKVISDKKTEEILGACIIGPKATELIAVFTLAISNKLKVRQIKETIFAHPTLSESIYEAL